MNNHNTREEEPVNPITHLFQFLQNLNIRARWKKRNRMNFWNRIEEDSLSDNVVSEHRDEQSDLELLEEFHNPNSHKL